MRHGNVLLRSYVATDLEALLLAAVSAASWHSMAHLCDMYVVYVFYRGLHDLATYAGAHPA